MTIKLIGLGKMGLNIGLNMKDHGYAVLGFDVDETKRNQAKQNGLNVVERLEDFFINKKEKHIVYLMIPAGKITENVIEEVRVFLKKDDIIIDAGNSNFNDSIRRYNSLKTDEIDFVDVGTSGGTSGARYGASLMVGGDKKAVNQLNDLFTKLAKKEGYYHVGKPGTGHYVKMVHNGIEYGMMQAIGEGFELMHHSGFDIDYEALSKVWNNGSVIESALMGYIHEAFKKDSQLSKLEGVVDDSGEAMWMVEEALKHKVSIPVITQSLYARYESKDKIKFSEKVVAAMRNEFGGHATYKKE